MKTTRIDASRWQEYKKLRLEAVADSPESFLDTVEETLALTDEEWQYRVTNMIFELNESDELVGMVGCIQEQKEKLRHMVHVVSVYVTPDYRGQGIAKRLMQAVLDFARSTEGVTTIQLEVISTKTAAVQLYQSLGFEVTGTRKKAIKSQGLFYDEWLMELQLA